MWLFVEKKKNLQGLAAVTSSDCCGGRGIPPTQGHQMSNVQLGGVLDTELTKDKKAADGDKVKLKATGW